MIETYITFDYDGITDPETGIEHTDESAAYAQWRREFEEAMSNWPEALAWKVLLRNSGQWRCPVRIIILDQGWSRNDIVDAVQTHLYDEGCLSCGFRMGNERTFVARHQVETVVLALDLEDARRILKERDIPGVLISVDEVDNATTAE